MNGEAFSDEDKTRAGVLIDGLDPVFVALLKRRTAIGGLVADLTSERTGHMGTVRFPAATVSRLSDTVNNSPQGVLDPDFIREVTDTISREVYGQQ